MIDSQNPVVKKTTIFYGWIIVACVFVILFVIFGSAYSFSTFFESLQTEFDTSRSSVSLVFAIAGFIYFSLGAISGQIADRFGTRGTAWTFRDLVATSGASLRADYEFHKEHRMFDAPSPGGVNALMRLLFKSKKLEQRLVATKQAQIAKAREERLAAYLRRGRLGEGKEISS